MQKLYISRTDIQLVLGCTVVSFKTTLKKTVFGSQAFTIMDQNRDGFIDKNDLRDTFAALGTSLTSALRYLGDRHLSGLICTVCFVSCAFGATGRLNVKQEEIDEMLKEAPGPINFTVFLTMFGEKLKGKDTKTAINNVNMI